MITTTLVKKKEIYTHYGLVNLLVPLQTRTCSKKHYRNRTKALLNTIHSYFDYSELQTVIF